MMNGKGMDECINREKGARMWVSREEGWGGGGHVPNKPMLVLDKVMPAKHECKTGSQVETSK